MYEDIHVLWGLLLLYGAVVAILAVVFWPITLMYFAWQWGLKLRQYWKVDLPRQRAEDEFVREIWGNK